MSSTLATPVRPSVLIVSPALAQANNGNWHTAARWARMLKNHSRCEIASSWHGQPIDLLIALHARRSAASVEAYAQAFPQRPLVLVLTGTDLYRDIAVDAAAQRSLQLASFLVVLQDQGLQELPVAWRAKARVIYQSAAALSPVPPPRRLLKVVSVGHMREEKDPATYMRAAHRLRGRTDIRFEQIGEALDPQFAAAAHRLAADSPRYRWLGALPRSTTRQHVRHAQLLVNTSRMEGGAQVILEAAQSGTAVLASKISGNVGMLGPEHAGYFELGDDAELALLIARARDEAAFLATLRAQTVARAPWFTPAEEQRRLIHLIDTALETPR